MPTTLREHDVASSSDSGGSISRTPSRVQGPRPRTARLSRSAFAEDQDLWAWAHQRDDLSRGPSISCRLSDSSNRPPSPSLSLSSSLSQTSSSARDDTLSVHDPCHQNRRKPAGPRAPCRSRRRPRKPLLQIDTSARRDESRLSRSTDSFGDAEFVYSHTPRIPPSLSLSPNNFLLDWDVIFRVLGCSPDISQDR